MRRDDIAPRPGWQAKVEDLGFVWHSGNGVPYWNEGACYVFRRREIGDIEEATRRLYTMFVEAGHYVVDQGLLGRFGIPDWCHDLVREAWQAAPPALNYGRFDLGFDGEAPPKLFEFNCDTPTSLLEAAVVQWFWKEEVFPDNDQFNSLHEALLAKWRDIAPYLADKRVHFGRVQDHVGEDQVTTAYMMDLAREAGLSPVAIAIKDIGWGLTDGDLGRFYDLDDREIRTLYKLYPWEWMVNEPFGRSLAKNGDRTRFIEPIWKMIWSNKAILGVLWDLYPRHPNLLWARQDAPIGDSYVKKPMLGREGGNVQVVRAGTAVHSTEGPYTGPAIYQGLFDLPVFDGKSPVIGSWCVDGEPAGMGIREDGPVTSNLAQFVPHIIE